MTLKLDHFHYTEFRGWEGHYPDQALLALDAFRKLWGAPVYISPAAGALGREMPAHRKSQHNVNAWGGVITAFDVFPQDMTRPDDRLRGVITALDAGFRGIGVYPDWSWPEHNLQGGLHLDMRQLTETASGRDYDARPALWAAQHQGGRQKFGPIDWAMPKGIGVPEILEEWKRSQGC